MSNCWRPPPYSALLLALSVSGTIFVLPVGQALGSAAPRDSLSSPLTSAPSANALLMAQATSTDSDRAIRPGSRGRYVTQIQLMLSHIGLYDGDLDGSYGDTTEQAVREFQQEQGLPVTGAVDRETWVQLRDAFVEAAAVNSGTGAGATPPAQTESADSGGLDDATFPQASGTSGEGAADADGSVPGADASEGESEASDAVTNGADAAAGDGDAVPLDGPPAPAPVPWVRLSLFMVAIATAFYALGRISVERRGNRIRWPESQTHSKPAPVESPEAATTNAAAQGMNGIGSATTPLPSIPNGSLNEEMEGRSPDSSPVPAAALAGTLTQSSNESSTAEPLTQSSANLEPTSESDDVADESRLVTFNTSELTKPLDINPTTRIARIDIVQELIHELHSPDPTIRRKAIWELGQRGTTEAIQPLIDLMVDVDSQQRSLILAAVSEIGVRTLKPLSRALVTSLQDESSDVRKNAIRDISRVYELITQVSIILRHAADDEDAEVRETACWALDQLNRLRVPPALDEMSHSPNQISGKTP